MSGCMEVTVSDMLHAREARFFMQQTLLAQYPGSSVVCLTMNIAGPIKVTPDIERAFSWGAERVRAILAGSRVMLQSETHEKTGAEAFFVVQGEAREIKRRVCVLEDGCAMGRLLDIDVIARDGKKISRTEIGLPCRKCLLCGQDAPVCARSRAHTVAQLTERTHAIIDTHFAEEFAGKVGRQAQRALLTEAAISPKPGLVDRMNAGAHSDMDIFTFIDSSCGLRDYFVTCARMGLAFRGGRPQDCFDALRTQGLLAEAEMRRATNGVNTHKGAIFSLGIYAASLGLGYDGERSDAVCALLRCGEMTEVRMREELAAIEGMEARSFGEVIYQKYRAGGVRSEAAGGFASVREGSLPRISAAIDAGLTVNDAGLCALIALMARVQDTNVLHRGGAEAAEKLLADAKLLDERICRYMEQGTLGMHMEEIRGQLERWDAELSAARISPGGCADLLALTLMAYFM